MKGKNLILTGLVALVVGLLLVMFRQPLSNGGFVLVAGILFLGAGVMNITFILGSRDDKGKARSGAVATTFGWIASAAAVLLGLSMLIFKGAFVALVGFMFGVLLLFAALFQLFLLLFGTRPIRLSSWFYLVVAALVGGAIYIFLRKPSTAGEMTDVVVTGVGFMIFGLFTVIEGSVVGQGNRMIKKASDEAAREAARKLSSPKIEAKPEPTAETKTAGEPEKPAE